ncbi:hypothetical protein C8Q80DRAFT_1265792 [Daedaleopsis nitida]|nr:hypothetical protein C8Q80DRAFT_1265792 [Daedaleopsis nitida]
MASSRLPIPRRSRRVSFSDNVTEHYPRFTPQAAPSAPSVSGSYEPPATPHLGTCPLPGTPELALGQLHDAHADCSEDDTAALPAHARARAQAHAVHAAAHPQHRTNTPANSPVQIPTPTLSPSSTSTSSHSSSSSEQPGPDPDPERDLSPLLARFPIAWNVRAARTPAGLPGAGCLRESAFRSGRTSCVVHFVPDPSEHRDDWHVTVRAPSPSPNRSANASAARHRQPLTVGDVVARIGEELYTLDGGAGIYAGHPREAPARRERRTRLLGDVDEASGAFRALDLFPQERCFFVGLDASEAAAGGGEYDGGEPVYVAGNVRFRALAEDDFFLMSALLYI